MTKADYEAKVDELDKLLNDPDMPFTPARVWALLAETAHPSDSLDVGPDSTGT